MTAATELTVAHSVLDYGDRALLLEFDNTAKVSAWALALREAALPGVLDIVPASRTVLVKLNSPRSQGVTRQRLRKLRVSPTAIAAAPREGHPDVVVDTAKTHKERALITLEILRTGPLALVQDLGRPGLAHLGVTRSGAADRRSHTLANRLVANPADRATIEVTVGGFSARVHGGDLDIAVTGADTDPAVNGAVFGTNSIHHVRDGVVISLGTPHCGLRTYLGVRGGVDVTPVLGSRSYDVRSLVGPAPLRAGDVLPIGEHTDHYPELDQAPVAAITGGPVELRAIPGPRADWFVDPDVLIHTDWVASDRSDRVGMLLVGQSLRYRHPERQLTGEGTTRGAIQVPPNGLPVILGPDHPLTGSYPVVGVVIDDDIDKVAQVRPGQHVRLHWSRPRWAPRSAPASASSSA